MQSERNTGYDEKRAVRRRQLALCLAALLLVALAAFPFCAKTIGRAIYPKQYSQQVEYWSEAYGVDPVAVYAIIHTESKFRPRAESGVGARGLMQITEETFDWIKTQIAPEESVTFDDLYDPDTNIRFGAYYLSRCMQRYGDLATAAAAYHSGWGTVDELLSQEEYAASENTLSKFPYQQMNLYVFKVERAYTRYSRLYLE